MSLCDMIKPETENLPNNIKYMEHLLIQEEINAFVASRGKITEIPPGVSGLEDGIFIVNECKNIDPGICTTKVFAEKRKKAVKANSKKYKLPHHINRPCNKNK